MFFFRFIIFTLLLNLNAIAIAEENKAIPSTKFDKVITEKMVIEFMENIKNVYNSRKKTQIEAFFRYYADSDARFIKTSYLIDPDNADADVAQNAGVNLSRDEYIDFIANYLNDPEKYYYRYSNVQLKIMPNQTDALVSFQSNEVIINQILKTAVSEKFDKSLAASNCNMNVQLSGTALKIMGLNCITKTAKKTLDIDLQ